MHIETLVVGPIETNCYIVSDPDTKEAVIIDAGDEAPYILNYIAQHDEEGICGCLHWSYFCGCL